MAPNVWVKKRSFSARRRKSFLARYMPIFVIVRHSWDCVDWAGINVKSVVVPHCWNTARGCFAPSRRFRKFVCERARGNYLFAWY